MKNRIIANELRVSYYRNEKLSVEDFKSVTSSKLLEKVFRTIWNTDDRYQTSDVLRFVVK